MRAVNDERDYWQKGVEEMRTVAQEIADPELRQRLLALAESYERIAKQQESRAASEATLRG